MQETEPYVIVKNKKNGRARGSGVYMRRIYWGRIAAFVTLLCIAALCGVLWFVRSRNTVAVPARTFYFVSLGSFATQEEAQPCVARAEEAGGAGYVHEESGYRVYAACYPSLESAEKVERRLLAQGTDASVVELLSPRRTFVIDRESGDMSPAYGAELFDALYDLCLRVDKSEISVSAALLAVQQMSNEGKDVLHSAQKQSGKSDVYLCAVLTKVLPLLDALFEDATAATFPRRIKHTLCSMAVEICKTTQDFNI